MASESVCNKDCLSNLGMRAVGQSWGGTDMQ